MMMINFPKTPPKRPEWMTHPVIGESRPDFSARAIANRMKRYETNWETGEIRPVSERPYPLPKSSPWH